MVSTGSSFPPITVTVNVARNSPLNVINVAVTGGANLTVGDSVINIANTGFNGAGEGI